MRRRLGKRLHRAEKPANHPLPLHRLNSRQPPDHHIQKATDAGTDREKESNVDGLAHRERMVVARSEAAKRDRSAFRAAVALAAKVVTTVGATSTPKSRRRRGI